MKQYKFTDVTELPSYEDVGISFTINDVNVDSTVEGYDTLTVAGRELVPRDLQTRNYRTTQLGGKQRSLQNRDSTFGRNVLIGSTISTRTLVVQYRLKRNNNAEFIDSFETLNYYINKENARLIFGDDPEYFYIGTLSQVDDVEPDSNDIISTFGFECMDSFKYSVALKELSIANGTTIDFGKEMLYPIALEKIELTVANSITDGFRLTNTSNGLELHFLGAFNAGDVITIDMLEPSIKIEARDIANKLDILSDLEEWTVASGDSISITNNVTGRLYYREVIL